MIETRLQPFLDLDRSYRAAKLLLADMKDLLDEVGKVTIRPAGMRLFLPAQPLSGTTREKRPTAMREWARLITDGRLVWAVADIVATYSRRKATGFTEALGWVAKLELHRRYLQIAMKPRLMPMLAPAIEYVTKAITPHEEGVGDEWESGGAHDGNGLLLAQTGIIDPIPIDELRNWLAIELDGLDMAKAAADIEYRFSESLAWREQAATEHRGDAKQDEGENPTDPYADLRRFARDMSKQQRAVIDALCDADGELPLANVKVLCDWQNPIESAWNSLRMRLNKRLRSHGWVLRTKGGVARLTKRVTE